MEWITLIWYFCYALIVLGLVLYGLHRYSIIYLFLKNARNLPQPKMHFVDLPQITVQLPLFNELHVAERLLDAVGNLDYPKEKLQIQVLDDSTDATTAICKKKIDELVMQRGLDISLIHRTDRRGFKAGALENGLQSAKGDFIFILDADFVPPPDILHKMIHFFTDPKIGMIQARWEHLNRNHSLLTRVQAMFLDGHLLLEQTARNRSGRFFNFNGTGGIWRKQCIREAGGWQQDTLTEDLDLSYRAQLKGWKFIFLSDVIAPAELPIDMNGFKSQQHRWTKGSIQTCKKLLPHIWKSDIPLLTKLEATMHLSANFAYLLLFLLCFLIYPTHIYTHLNWEKTLLYHLPIFSFAFLSVALFYLCSQSILYPQSWKKEILHLPMLFALGIGMSLNNGKAVLEALFNHRSDFIRTPKYGGRETNAQSPYRSLKTFLPYLELLLAVYFSYLLYLGFKKEIWFSLPFLILFQVGFLYVAFGSLKHHYFHRDKNFSSSLLITSTTTK